MILDTNIIIAYLAGEDAVVATCTTWKKEGHLLFIPAIVEAELLSFSSLSPTELKNIQLFLEENFIFIPCDRSIARMGATLRRTAGVALPDALIAATALQNNLPIVTRNIKDFKKMPIKTITI